MRWDGTSGFSQVISLFFVIESICFENVDSCCCAVCYCKTMQKWQCTFRMNSRFNTFKGCWLSCMDQTQPASAIVHPAVLQLLPWSIVKGLILKLVFFATEPWTQKSSSWWDRGRDGEMCIHIIPSRSHSQQCTPHWKGKFTHKFSCLCVIFYLNTLSTNVQVYREFHCGTFGMVDFIPNNLESIQISSPCFGRFEDGLRISPCWTNRDLWWIGDVTQTTPTSPC